MDIECELLEIPDVDYDAELVIQSASFANGVSTKTVWRYNGYSVFRE
jgi:hypothetical protein